METKGSLFMTQILSRLINKICFFAPGGSSIRPVLQRARGAIIGKNVWISQYVYFDELHPEGIQIGNNVTIGLRTSIINHFYWGPRKSKGGFKKIIIGDDVFIGPHCLILPGVHIGKGAVVKGGTTVSRDVPKNVFWGAQDAKPIAKCTVPLTAENDFESFIAGLRPFRKNIK